MTIYFAGGEMGAFVPTDSSVAESDTAGGYNSAFARTSMRVTGSTAQYAESADFSAPDECYYHFDFSTISGANSGDAFVLNASGTDVFRVQFTGSALQMQALISAVWTNVGSAVPITLSSVQTVDLYIDGNTASGTATLFLSGQERTTASPDLTAVTGVTNIRTYGTGYGTYGISQIIVADVPTISWRLATVELTGAGANTAWTGTYTSVDETIYSDADFIYSGTPNQVETYTGTTPTLTGYTIRAVGVYARSKRGASGPANLQLALRVNATDFFSASKAQSIGYGAYGNIWEDNPDTGVDWLVADLSNTQFGVKSIT